ncbi:MAG: hypothetical protein JWR26_1164 [Pedosphaera sp.]|nr:hypothetical protein [Pedosphaera sp.]
MKTGNFLPQMDTDKMGNEKPALDEWPRREILPRMKTGWEFYRSGGGRAPLQRGCWRRGVCTRCPCARVFPYGHQEDGRGMAEWEAGVGKRPATTRNNPGVFYFFCLHGHHGVLAHGHYGDVYVATDLCPVGRWNEFWILECSSIILRRYVRDH